MKISRVLFYILILTISAGVLYPVYVLFLIAFTPAKGTILSLTPLQYPGGFTLSNLQNAFKTGNLIAPTIKSLETATLVGTIALALGIPAAYGLSKLSTRLANIIATLLFLVNMLPAIVIAIPVSAEFISIHLWDTVPGLALAQELVALPLTIFILLGGFQSLPKDLENQARVDGAGMVRTLFLMLVPLAKAAVAAAFLLSWMISWDEFTFAVILSPLHQTLPLVIYLYITRGDILAASAFALVVTIPVIILTILLQKFLRGEYLSGGLTG